MNRILKILRILVSLTVFAILGSGLLMPVLVIPGVNKWLMEIRLDSAITLLSLTIFVFWILITLVFGRIYCSTMCPMGTLMDISAAGSRRLAGKEARIYRYSPPNNALRYSMVGVLVVCLLGGFAIIPQIIQPSSAFVRICRDCLRPFLQLVANSLARMGVMEQSAEYIVNVSVAASIVATFMFAVTLVISSQSGRTLCNTICPIGTILGVVSRYSLFQIDIDTDKCTQCRRCVDVCKAHCIDLTDHVIDGSRCINCFDCLNVCSDDAIHYTTNRKRLSDPMMIKLTSMAKPREEGAEAETTIVNPDRQIANIENNSKHNETIS